MHYWHQRIGYDPAIWATHEETFGNQTMAFRASFESFDDSSILSRACGKWSYGLTLMIFFFISLSLLIFASKPSNFQNNSSICSSFIFCSCFFITICFFINNL